MSDDTAETTPQEAGEGQDIPAFDHIRKSFIIVSQAL